MGLKLKIEPYVTVDASTEYQVFDFDNGFYGTADVPYFGSSIDADIAYGKKMTFKLYLDNSIGYNDLPVIQFYGNSGNDLIDLHLDGSLFAVYAKFGGTGGWRSKYYEIGDYYGEVISCEINKSRSGSYGQVDSFIINGDEQTSVGQPQGWTGATSSWILGRDADSTLDNATVFEIKIYDTSTGGSPLIHHWAGYPNAAADAAWVDLVGSKDGEILNGPGNNRNVVEYSDASASGTPNKLSIIPGGSKLLLYDPLIGLTTFTLDSSFVYTDQGKTPLWGPTYYNNYMIQHFLPAGGGGGQEQIRTISIDGAGVMTAEASIAYSYPHTQTVLDGILYVSKLFSTISSFYVNPATGEISKWVDNNSPIVLVGAQRIASAKGKLISTRGYNSSDIEVYSYSPVDSSGTLTRDSSLTFPTSYQSTFNNRIVSGENFTYLMRITDSSVVTTDILTITGGVLTDTGYDVSIYANYDEDVYFSGFEDNGNLYLSYNGLGVYQYSINQSTGEPTFVKNTSETTSVGIDSGIVGNKLINESNDVIPSGYLKSFNLDTLELDGSILRDGGNLNNGSGIITIDSDTFVTSNLTGTYSLDSFTLSFT